MSTMSSLNSDSLKEYKQQAMKEFNNQNNILKKRVVDAHHQYVKPVIAHSRKMAEKRPIAAALISLFLAFSSIPLISFTFFTLSTIAIISSIAIFWSTVLIAGAAILLVASLSFTGFLALTSLFWGLIAYESYRLVVILLASNSLVEGLKTFENESRSLFLGTAQQVQADTSRATTEVIDHTKATNGVKAE